MTATTTHKIGDTLTIEVITGPFKPGDRVTIVAFARDPRMALVSPGVSGRDTYLHLDHLQGGAS